jgi:hypothetical protein
MSVIPQHSHSNLDLISAYQDFIRFWWDLVCDDCHNLIHEIGIDSVIGDISIYQNTIHL